MNNSALLDCSSIDSALTSLAGLLGLSVDEFRDAVRRCVIDWDASVGPEDQLVRVLGFRDEADMPKPTGTRWFHATRALPETTFSEGLLPTQAVLPLLWNTLGNLTAPWTSPETWLEYQRSFATANRHYAVQFRQKRIDRGWEGPFAFLVRDAALGRHGRRHKDFTKMSEALEDVCADYEEVFGHPLGQAYQVATNRCLVIFTQPGPYPGAVSAALNYVHRALHDLDCGIECNTCFCGEGEAVPASWIERVEWLPDVMTGACLTSDR